MAVAQRSDFAVEAAVAATAAAVTPRCDLSSGRTEGSEARANPPPPGLSAARLPQRLPTSSLWRPPHPQQRTTFPSRLRSARPLFSRNYTSQKVLQCAGAPITYNAFFNFAEKEPNSALHFPEDRAARLSRKAGDHGELTLQHVACGSGRRAGFRNSGRPEAPALRILAINAFRP